jgi:type I restriction enzyme R subunit
MIAHYIVINETHKVMMILRPYQYFATEAIIHQVKNLMTTLTFGTPGSGKTLTSFKASQIDGIARRVQSRFL